MTLFTALPLDIWFELIDQLSIQDVVRLMQVCKALNVMLDHPAIWKLFTRRFAEHPYTNTCPFSIRFSSPINANTKSNDPRALAIRILRFEHDASVRKPYPKHVNDSRYRSDGEPAKLIPLTEHSSRRAFKLAPPPRPTDDSLTKHQYASIELLQGGRWVIALCVTRNVSSKPKPYSWSSDDQTTQVAVVLWDLEMLDAMSPRENMSRINVEEADEGEVDDEQLPANVISLEPVTHIDLHTSCASRRQMLTEWDRREDALNVAVAYTQGRYPSSEVEYGAIYMYDEFGNRAKNQKKVQEFIEVIQLSWSLEGTPAFTRQRVFTRTVSVNHSEKPEFKLSGSQITRSWRGTNTTLIWNWKDDRAGEYSSDHVREDRKWSDYTNYYPDEDYTDGDQDDHARIEFPSGCSLQLWKAVGDLSPSEDRFRAAMIVSGWGQGIDLHTPSSAAGEFVQTMMKEYPYAFGARFAHVHDLRPLKLLVPRSCFGTNFSTDDPYRCHPDLVHHGICTVTGSLLVSLCKGRGWPDDANWEDESGWGVQYEGESFERHPERYMGASEFEYGSAQSCFSVFLVGE